MTLPDLFRNYLIDRRGISRITAKNYASDIRRFTSWYAQNFQKQFSASDLTKDVVQLFITTGGGLINEAGSDFSVKNGQSAPRSFERYISSLRKFAQFLVDEKHILANPFEELAKEKPAEKFEIDPWHSKDFKNYLYVYGASSLTIKNYLVDINAFCAWATQVLSESGKAQSAGSITISLIEEYKQRLTNVLGLSPKSVNRKLSAIRKYIEFANKQGLIKNQLPVKSFEAQTEAEVEKAPGLKLEDLNEIIPTESMIGRKYSSFPPLRLVQRLFLPYELLEDLIAGKIVDFINSKRRQMKAGISIFSGLPFARKLTKDELKAARNGEMLLNVHNYPKEMYAPHEISLAGKKWYEKLVHHAKYTRPNWYKRYHNYAFAHYLHFAILIIYASAVGFIIYSSLFGAKSQAPVLAAGPTAPPRILSFQGRLTDNNDNPITTSTYIRFQIYDDASATGSGHLLWQEVDQPSPDQDGIFSQLLGNGSTCGGTPITVQQTACAIPSSVFTDHANLYLGITIGSTAELAPRQQLATVAFAANSESLQGMLPITDVSATQQNVVLALDSSGNLTIGGSANPTFQASGGQFKLSGQPLVLVTNTGSNGNVQIAPDGTGKIDLEKPLVNNSASGNLVPGGVEINDKAGVLATESAVAAFTINNDTTGGDIFTASSSGTQRFTIANNGDVNFAAGAALDTITTGTLSIGGTRATTLTLGRSGQGITLPGFTGQNGVLYGTSGTGVLGQVTTPTAGLCLQSGVSNPTWGTCSTSINYWAETNGLLYPGNTTVDVAFGGTSTSSAKFRFQNVNTGTPVASISANSSDNATYLTGDGILATTNKQTLTLGSSSTGNIVINGFGAGLVHSNASGVLSSSAVNLAGGSTEVTGILPVSNGGTGINGGAASNGTLLIGNGSGYTLATLTAGTGINITNGAGSITIANSQGNIDSFWNQTNGLLYPNNSTVDFAIGGQASNSAKFAVLGVAAGLTPTASVSAQTANGSAIYLDSTGSIQEARNNSLTIGGATTGNITISPLNGAAGSNLTVNSVTTTLSGTTTLTASSLTTITSASTLGVSATTLNLGGGSTATIDTPSSAALNIGTTNATTLTLGRSGQNISLPGYNSAGGVFYSNSGTLAMTSAGTSTQCLLGGSTPSFGSCAQQDLYWNQTNGLLYPNNSTVDFAIGGQASTSAKFAVININSGNPTASVSAQTAGGSAVYIDSTGSIQETRNNSLTIGGTTTGNITISPLNGAAGSNLTVNSVTTTLSGTTTLTASSLATITSASTLGVSATTLNLGNGSAATLATTSNQNLTVSAGSGTLNLNTVSNGAVTTGTGLTTLGGNLTINGATTTFANASPTITTGTNTTLTISPNGTGNLVLAADFDSGVTIGTAITGKFPLLVRDGIGSNAALAVDQLNTGDIFTASSSGTTKFTISNTGALTDAAYTNNGGILYTSTTGLIGQTAAGSSSQCLLGGATPTWGSCGSGTTTSPFEELSGAIVPLNSTEDFLIGAQASNSAKFAVLNVNSGTPVASVSSGLNGTSTYLTADGSLSTQNRHDLTIGNSSTYNTSGNVLINPNGTGNIGIGVSTPVSGLDVRVNSYFANSLTLANNININFTATSGNAALITLNGSNQLVFRDGTGGYIFTNNSSSTVATLLDNGTFGLGTSTPTSELYVTRPLAFGATGKALAVFDQIENQDILTASSGGTPRFTVANTGALTDAAYTNAGGVLYTSTTGLIGQTAAGTSSDCLTGGTTPSFAPCAGTTAGSIYWNQNNGLLFPKNSTVDVSIGGQSTASAKFAFINVNSGVPTATISAGTANNYAFVTGDGTFGTTNAETLTLGGTGSGNIVIDSGSNVTQVADNTFKFTSSNPVISSLNTLTINAFTLGGQISAATNNISNVGTLDFGTNNLSISASTITSSATNGSITVTPTGSGNTILTSDFNSGVYIGSSSNTPATLSVTGGIGSNAGFIVNRVGSTDDIIAASSSGSTKFVLSNSGLVNVLGGLSSDIDTLTGTTLKIGATTATTLTLGRSGQGITLPAFATNNNSVLYTGSAGALGAATTTGTNQCLLSNGSGAAPSWGACTSGGTDVYWQQANGLLFPNNSTVDFAIGGQSTASAKFAITGINGTTTTATISGNLSLSVPTTAGANKFSILNNGNLGFYTSVGGTTVSTPSLFIANGDIATPGNVGIGTATPTQGQLQVHNASGQSTLAITTNVNVGSGNTNQLSFISDVDGTPSYATIGQFNTPGLRLSGDADISSTPHMFISSAGNVGIGTTAPATLLASTGTIAGTSAPATQSAALVKTAQDTTGTTGQYTSIAIEPDGLPVVSYYDASNAFLKVAKCTVSNCSSSTTTTTVDNTADVGQFSSIAVGQDGFPVISYYDNTNHDLKVVKCGNGDCSSGNTTTTIDSTGDVGQYTSIAVGSDGLPVVSYYDVTNGDLKIAHCSNASCSSSTNGAVVSTNDVGKYSSMAIGTDGFPVISYSNTTSTNTSLVHCTNITCTTSDTPVIIKALGNVGTSTAIGTDGFPEIVLDDSLGSGLYAIHCSNVACTSSTSSSSLSGSIATTSNVMPLSLTIGRDGLGVIVFSSSTASRMNIAKCTNVACSSVTTTLVELSVGGRFVSIAIGTDSLPVFSFYSNNTGQDLYIGKCGSTDCSGASFNTVASGIQLGGIIANSRSYSLPFQNLNTLSVSNPTTWSNLAFNTAGTDKLYLTPGGTLKPALDNTYDLGATSTARFRSLYLGPGSDHIQCTTADGCGQNLDYALGINTSTGTFSIGVNGATSTGNPLLNITQGGNVGIGTTTPGVNLGDTTPGTTLGIQGTGSYGFLQITKSTTGLNEMGRITFGSPAYSGTDKRTGIIISNSETAATDNPTGNLVFYTNNAGTLGERLRITGAGNIGIGTNTPQATLDVAGSASESGNLSMRGAATAHTFNILDNGTLNFQRSPGGDTGVSSVLFLSSAGNVGIGTTSPGAVLDVAGTMRASSWVDRDNTNYFLDPAATGTSLAVAGNVGIGVTNPSASLSVFNTNTTGADSKTGLLLDRVFGSVGDTEDIVFGGGSGDAANRTARISANAIAGGYGSLDFYAQTGGGDGYTNRIARFSPYDGSSGLVDFDFSTSVHTHITASGCGSFGGITFGSTITGCTNYSLLGDGTSTYINRPTGGAILFREANSDQFYIKTGGNIGIATTAPAALLDTKTATNRHFGVRDNSSGTQILGMTDAAGAYAGLLVDGSSTYINSQSGGNVGIGGTSVAAKLDVNGTIAVSGFPALSRVTNYIVLQDQSGQQDMFLGGAGDPTNYYRNTTHLIQSIGGSSTYATINSTGLNETGTGTFVTSVTVNSGAQQGAFVMNSSAADPGISLANSGTGGHTYQLLTSSGATGLAQGQFTIYDPSVGARLSISAAGNTTISGCLNYNGGSIGTCLSDQRLKQNVQPFTAGLEDIIKLAPKTFQYNGLADTVNDGREMTGLIAQQVEQVDPNFVTSTWIKLHPDDTQLTELKQVKYQYLTFALINATKELNDKINALTGGFDMGSIDTLNITAKTDANGNVITPHIYNVADALGNPVSTVSAFASAVIGNLRAGAVNAVDVTAQTITGTTASIGDTTTNTLAVATNSVTVAGQSLQSYIVNTIQSAINSGQIAVGGNNNGPIVSPLASIDEIHTNTISPLATDTIDIKGNVNIKDSNNQIKARIDTNGNITAQTASLSGDLTANNASVSGNLASNTLTTNDATVSGTLYANNINANSITGLDAKIQNLLAGSSDISTVSAGTISAYHAQLADATIGTASGSLNTNFIDIQNMSADFGTFRQGLIALGPATFNQVTALDSFSVGTTLTIGPNSIDTLGDDLNIQPLKQGAVSFLAGAIRIETDGTLHVNENAYFAKNVEVKGNLSAKTISPLPDQSLTIASNSSSLATNDVGPLLDIQGNVAASGSGTFNKLNLSLAQQAYALSDTESIATGSAGMATLKHTKSEITIDNPNVTANSLIYITPVGSTNNQAVYLERQVANTSTTPGSFTVGVDTPALTDIKFNWIIVN